MENFMNSFSLQGKVALITGASYGIGFNIARGFAAAGATIVFNDINQELVDKGLAAYQEEGIAAHGYVCDVTDEAAVNELVKKIEAEVGVIDILVNNAGITKDMLLMRMTEEQFDSVIQTNLKGTFNMIRHASSIMLKQRSGAIINMSSVVGVMGNVGQANYAASKAGIIGLTKSTAKELAARGVTCNAIAPGFVETDMTAALSEDLQKQMLETIPLKRYGQVDDIAQAAVFLAKNTYITGQVLHVDGGMCM